MMKKRTVIVVVVVMVVQNKSGGDKIMMLLVMVVIIRMIAAAFTCSQSNYDVALVHHTHLSYPFCTLAEQELSHCTKKKLGF